MYVRGCEIEGMLDANGRVIEEGPEPRPNIAGDTRSFRVVLDSNQYKIDMDTVTAGGEVRLQIFNVNELFGLKVLTLCDESRMCMTHLTYS